jgi:hypothetical protein
MLHMSAHMLPYVHQGGWGVGRCINIPDEYCTYVTEHVAVVKMETNVHAPQEKPESVQKRDTWAYSWTWRYNVALLQSVAAALPKALWR